MHRLSVKEIRYIFLHSKGSSDGILHSSLLGFKISPMSVIPNITQVLETE